MNERPLIAHVLYRLDTGGMEHMLVTLINHTRSHYRHAVICLDRFGALRDEIVDPGVQCVALNKRPGKDWRCYIRLWQAIRRLQPDLVHTYNIGALDAVLVARLAGVHRVVHAERGRDASDPNGKLQKYRVLRRWLAPFINRYVAVSRDLQDWLIDDVGIDPARVVHIPNGIDVSRFVVTGAARAGRPVLGSFAPPGAIVIGTVGRLDPVKDQAGLLSTFKLLCESLSDKRRQLRLALVGKGPQRPALEAQIDQLGLRAQVRLLGNRDDVPALLSEFDIFALSSVAEGMPGAVLEAMAAGLPVVATNVGGVAEVVADGQTGTLVPPSDPAALAHALRAYVDDAPLRRQHGDAGRTRALSTFGLRGMLSAYTTLYDQLLVGRGYAGTYGPSAPARVNDPKEP